MAKLIPGPNEVTKAPSKNETKADEQVKKEEAPINQPKPQPVSSITKKKKLNKADFMFKE